MAVTLYFTVAASLWLRESIHLALIMLQLNVLEGLLAIKIKSLNDCVAKAVQQMLVNQMEFAMLVSLQPVPLSRGCSLMSAWLTCQIDYQKGGEIIHALSDI
jgi:hypothetical protein